MLGLAVFCILNLGYHGLWEREDLKEYGINRG